MDRSESTKRLIRERERRIAGTDLHDFAKVSNGLRPSVSDNSNAEITERRASSGPLGAIERSRVDEARRGLERKAGSERSDLKTYAREAEPVQPDRDAIELERRQAEAAKDWRQNPEARVEFAQTVGRQEHKDWQAEIRRSEGARGRVEGKDYGVEYTVDHPDGGIVRYDYVDFKNHLIVDRKAQATAETDLTLVSTYKEQQKRHIEAYRSRFGRTPIYEYSPYPSTADLFSIDE